MTDLEGVLKRLVRFAPTRFQAPKEYVVEISKEGISFREKGRRAVAGPVPFSVILAKAEMYSVSIGGGK